MGRILNRKIKIDKKNVKEFFYGRKKRFEINPLTAVIYQDNNPELAKKRDEFEKKKILSLVELSKKDEVLDVACGIGRWAEIIAPKVNKYVGIDYCEPFIEYAITKYKNYKNVEFLVLDANNIKKLKGRTFSKIFIAGLLLYLNDMEVVKFFSNLKTISAENAVIYLREPMAVEKRLSLDNIWSEELEQNYSAIYRTKKELKELLSDFLKDFEIKYEGDMYEDLELNNRKETKQFIFIFCRNE